jgi:type I restriction enzyme S subunit
MNADFLLTHFNRISDVPDAVPRFRRFVLDLAVRGKLVEQDRKDEPASQLFKRIQREWERLFGEGTVKNAGLSREIQDDERPYSIPNSWQWVRLGQCLEMINGRAFKPTDWRPAGLPIVRIQNLNSEDAPFNYCDESIIEPRHIIESGNFLISWSGTPGTSFGAFIWTRGKAALNQHIFKCVQIGGAYYDRFLQIAINGRLDEMIAKAHGGVGLQHITKGKLENLLLSLPPLAEQRRIVTKVDELMSLCDRLEAARTEQQANRISLAAASHHRLNNRPNPETFRQSAKFYLTHLSHLIFQSDQIKLVRQTILNLAVRGQLVPQDFNDAPVSELLGRIMTEKADLIGARAQEREYGESRLSNEDIPFDLPSSWQWEPLQSVIVFGPQNGISPKPSSRPDAPRAVTLTATTKGTFDSRYFKQVDASIPQDSEFWLRPGDLLFQRGNTREYVGMAAYYSGEPGLFLYPDLMIKVRLSEKVSLRYVHLCSVAPHARTYFSTHASGAQATMPKINQGVLVKLPIPLAPFAEQNRIVAKVDELMALCDQLEVQLSTAQSEQRSLLESVLHHALGDIRPTPSDLSSLIGTESDQSRVLPVA